MRLGPHSPRGPRLASLRSPPFETQSLHPTRTKCLVRCSVPHQGGRGRGRTRRGRATLRARRQRWQRALAQCSRFSSQVDHKSAAGGVASVCGSGVSVVRVGFERRRAHARECEVRGAVAVAVAVMVMVTVMVMLTVRCPTHRWRFSSMGSHRPLCPSLGFLARQ